MNINTILPKIYLNWSTLTPAEQQRALQRPIIAEFDHIKTQTALIMTAVKNQGDAALQKFTQQFDHVTLNQFAISADEINAAKQAIPIKHQQAIKTAISHLSIFHQAQLPKPIQIKTCTGVVCERYAKPIARVGLYVPGGSAPLVSTVMMLAIPAKIAHCPTRLLTTPPNADGHINPHILFTADLCGISQIYKIGGAQAIAALAYGTETVPKVDKIFGPGNAWVTQAKLLAAEDPDGADLDLPAGPSELFIIADQFSNPEFIAADLLSQAEHGVDSQVILVSTTETVIHAVNEAILRQLQLLPRKAIATQALLHSRMILVDNMSQAIEISNQYAPEHLILNIQQAETWAQQIHSAGAVFIGPWSAETLGDYVTGSNHVLPTYGFARNRSGLSTVDFMKFINFQTISQEGLMHIGEAANILAEIEGLQAHKSAVSVRMSEITAKKLELY